MTNQTEQSAALTVTVPPELVSNEKLTSFFEEKEGVKTFNLGGLAKSYLESQSALPAVPETAEAYQFEFPQDFPVDEADSKLQKEMAKEAGMTQKQYEAMVKFDLARLGKFSEEAAKAFQQAEKTLKAEWKGDFQTNVTMAKKAADAIFGKEFAERADVGNDPQILKGLFLIAKKMGEDIFRKGDSSDETKRPQGPDGRPRLKFKSMGDK
jgi:hypothetical protein